MIAYFKHGKLRTASSWVDEMLRHNVLPDESCFGWMLRAAGEAGDSVSAKKLFNIIVSRQVSATCFISICKFINFIQRCRLRLFRL